MLANLRRVFGDTVSAAEIERLAAAHYGHLWRLAGEFIRFPWMSEARKRTLLCVENLDALVAAMARGKGVLVLTGHFGNSEVAIAHRVTQARFRVFPKCGPLDAMLARLDQGDVIVFPFDQHTRSPDGIEVDFFGYPAWTCKSLAIIAHAAGACCGSKRRCRPSIARIRTRRSGATRLPLTGRWNAWSSATRSSGIGCNGAGCPRWADGRRGRSADTARFEKAHAHRRICPD